VGDLRWTMEIAAWDEPEGVTRSTSAHMRLLSADLLLLAGSPLGSERMGMLLLDEFWAGFWAGF